MATTEKPIALQTDYQKSVSSFESFLSPEEEQIEQTEEIIEDELIEEADQADEADEAAEIDELEEVNQEDLPEEEFEEQSEVEEVEQPQFYTVKVDGVEQEVTLEELQRGYSRQQDYTRKTQELSQERKTLEQQQAEKIQSLTLEKNRYGIRKKKSSKQFKLNNKGFNKKPQLNSKNKFNKWLNLDSKNF
jgi:hypothetical protein